LLIKNENLKSAMLKEKKNMLRMPLLLQKSKLILHLKNIGKKNIRLTIKRSIRKILILLLFDLF